jgi:uncharacterized protein YndB with AHSA1/START domain
MRFHMNPSDRIEKTVVLRASVSRVWQAISTAREFGRWFGIELKGDFAAGQTIRGTFSHGFNEAKILELQKRLGLPPSNVRIPEAMFVFCTVERIEPERFLSFRWIPYAIDAEADPETEPTTLVEFQLEKVAEGTRLTIVESGFEHVPQHRRQRAFRMNEAGWSGQMENVRQYVQGA